MDAATIPAPPSSSDRVRLQQYLRSLAVCAVGFGALGLGIGLGNDDAALRDVGAVVLCYAAFFVLGDLLAGSGRVQTVVWMQCIGIWVAAPLLAAAWPGILPIITMVPFFSLGFGLPFLRGPAMRTVTALTWVSTITTLAVGLSLPDRSTSPKPLLYTLLFVGAALAAGILLIILWQAYERQMETVQRLRDSNVELELSTRARTQFFNNAAHELQTPLTPIVLQLHLLDEALRHEDGDAARHSYDVLHRNLNRLRRHVDFLLDAARIQSQGLELALSDVDLARVARRVFEAYREQARAARLILKLEAPAPVWIRGDEHRLVDVVSQLVDNAIKFTPEGGSILVRVVGDGVASISVRDTGVGLAPEQKRRLFQPFLQAHEASVGPARGSGLGLYLAQGIASAHGGRIDAQSDGLGTGSTFTITLPLVAARERQGSRDPQGS